MTDQEKQDAIIKKQRKYAAVAILVTVGVVYFVFFRKHGSKPKPEKHFSNEAMDIINKL